ncbi:hypothetical protein GCM10010274_32750 [Streptomyces lavendofoliae]|uniref:Uncharacterized protein n=1 Tax=Streptomyces lavendofoliae TaxID=67314 RepID=A0A918HXL1_9ACTN|nr:hypothetical protein GCM10010274_32750 [Streptomyces lavendofoliae]
MPTYYAGGGEGPACCWDSARPMCGHRATSRLTFGANASGTSNVLAAMTDLRGAVRNPQVRWTSYDGTDRTALGTARRARGAPP